jgi:3-methylfumaryl-CoA hydratase
VMTSHEINQWGTWAPESSSRSALITRERARQLANLIFPDTGISLGGHLPILWHWIYESHEQPLAAYRPDGHLASGPLVPPFTWAARRYAGSRIEVGSPIPFDTTVTWTNRVARVRPTTGRTGQLVFVTFESTLTSGGSTHLREETDIAYIIDPIAVGGPVAAQAAVTARGWTGDRYVADQLVCVAFGDLVGNRHRIHYDQSYAREIEGLPGVIVPGLLLALLGMQAAGTVVNPGSRISLQARRALYAGEAIAFGTWPSDDVTKVQVFTDRQPEAFLLEISQ